MTEFTDQMCCLPHVWLPLVNVACARSTTFPPVPSQREFREHFSKILELSLSPEAIVSPACFVLFTAIQSTPIARGQQRETRRGSSRPSAKTALVVSGFRRLSHHQKSIHATRPASPPNIPTSPRPSSNTTANLDWRMAVPSAPANLCVRPRSGSCRTAGAR